MGKAVGEARRADDWAGERRFAAHEQALHEFLAGVLDTTGRALEAFILWLAERAVEACLVIEGLPCGEVGLRNEIVNERLVLEC